MHTDSVQRPTIKDIAREAGVSRGAVSFALNDRPGVSDETRARVKQVAAELGWTPNVAARALSAKRAHAVGLVIARPTDAMANEAFFLKLIAGLERVLTEASTSLVLQLVDTIDEEVEVYRRWWSEKRVDGVVVTDPRVDDPRFDLLRRYGLPAVVIGSIDTDADLEILSSVSIDDAATTAVVVEHLSELGHERVAHVGGTRGLVHTDARTIAFRTAAEERGMTAHTVATDFTEDAGQRSTSDLLDSETPPTAILYDNEILALGGLVAINEAGLRVPHDVAVVSWEDSSICRVVSPPLTTLSRDPGQLGARSAELLLRLVDHGTAEHVTLTLPPLLVRGSTDPAVAS